MRTLPELLQLASNEKASDLFIKSGARPALRVHGKIRNLDLPVLSGDDVRDLCHSVMNHEHVGAFERRHELDLAFTIEGVCRIRANMYQQKGTMGLVCRLIPLATPSLEELKLPAILGNLCQVRQGLVLVTGPTGCGKSTTLAAMIDRINSTRETHIVTIEEPMEYVHPDKLSIVSQREVGIDTESFTDGLKYVLRQSPDIILVGEMRDVETMSVSMQAAETGHLVFSTVHTASAAETMDRIINMFPPHEKNIISMRLANALRGIVSQKLIPNKTGDGRVAGVEVLIATPTISKMIEDTHFSSIYAAITEGGFWGMQTMNQSLYKYYKQGIISEEEALLFAGNLTELKQMFRR